MNFLTPFALLACYVSVIGVASIIGGRASEYGAISHTRTQVIISFVAGFILGMAIFHLLPHALESVQGTNSFENVAIWVIAGILVLIVMLRVFDFHRHEFGEEGVDPQGNQYDTDKPLQTNPRSLIGIVLGLSLHTITEGVTLGAGTRMASEEMSTLPGLAIALAIVLHKPLDAYSITALMRSMNHSGRMRLVVNVAFALICPLVAVTTYFFIGPLSGFVGSSIIGYALAFGVGAFLCIALSDLLPEISFHQHDRLKLLISLFVGIALAYGLYFVEELGTHGAS